MKKLLFILLLAIPMYALSQDPITIEGKYTVFSWHNGLEVSLTLNDTVIITDDHEWIQVVDTLVVSTDVWGLSYSPEYIKWNGYVIWNSDTNDFIVTRRWPGVGDVVGKQFIHLEHVTLIKVSD